MSVGSLQGCASTLPEVMQENRLQQLYSPVDNNQTSSNSVQSLRLDVEPASIDTINNDSTYSATHVNPINSVAAIEPISNSTIEATLANNKGTNGSYQSNGQQDQSSLAPGLFINIKV